jgi:hypothetical protein
MRVFWDIAPYSLIGADRRFRGAYCHHHDSPDDGGRMDVSKRRPTPTRLHGALSQKTLMCINLDRFGYKSSSDHVSCNWLCYIPSLWVATRPYLLWLSTCISHSEVRVTAIYEEGSMWANTSAFVGAVARAAACFPSQWPRKWVLGKQKSILPPTLGTLPAVKERNGEGLRVLCGGGLCGVVKKNFRNYCCLETLS